MVNAFFEDAMKQHEPMEMTIGAVREVLSRRKARKLAYQYKGGKRAKRYTDFLAGQSTGFWAQGTRLVRIPKFSKTTTIITLHANSAVAAMANIGRFAQFSFEEPTTFG